MKKLHHNNLQRQIENLIPLIELCIPIIEEMDSTKLKLNILPTELENLKKRAEILKFESYQTASNQTQNSRLESQIKETEFELDFLVNDLEEILLNLETFNHKIGNLVVIKERLEALQEERIDGLTPERIYRLLNQTQQNRNESLSNQTSSQTRKINLWGKKIVKYRNRRLAISLAIIGSLSLGWMAGYCSAKSFQLIENNTIETTDK